MVVEPRRAATAVAPLCAWRKEDSCMIGRSISLKLLAAALLLVFGMAARPQQSVQKHSLLMSRFLEGNATVQSRTHLHVSGH
jgi:hypothetical protein